MTIITDLKIVNELDTRLSHAVVGAKAFIQNRITNLQMEKQDLVYIVQVKHREGIIVLLSWIRDEISLKQSIMLDQLWIPEKDGIYTIEVFVWDDLDKPIPLASMLKRTIICYPLIK